MLPRLRVCQWETVVAVKYQALIKLGMINSRMKDFFDLRYMAKRFEFEGSKLSKAIKATFARHILHIVNVPEAGELTKSRKNRSLPMHPAVYDVFSQLWANMAKRVEGSSVIPACPMCSAGQVECN